MRDLKLENLTIIENLKEKKRKIMKEKKTGCKVATVKNYK